MTAQIISSRAECAYCGTQARPNAMYCMNCGQIVVAPRSVHTRSTQQAPAHAAVDTGGAASAPKQPAQASARGGMEQYLLPAVPNLPELSAPQPASAEYTELLSPATASTQVVAPPRPKLASADARIIELELPDGERTKIDGTAVLGRRPEATARNSGAQAIAVPDDSKSVSRAHAVIEIRGQAVSISDAGSANGSAVERDGAVLTLRSGRQI